MPENLERAERAEGSILWHRYNDNDDVTNLYDLICDLLHYADTLPLNKRDHPGAVLTGGEYVSEMALYHYREEVAEEAWEARNA